MEYGDGLCHLSYDGWLFALFVGRVYLVNQLGGFTSGGLL